MVVVAVVGEGAGSTMAGGGGTGASSACAETVAKETVPNATSDASAPRWGDGREGSTANFALGLLGCIGISSRVAFRRRCPTPQQPICRLTQYGIARSIHTHGACSSMPWT